jgi:hypothetical protein
MRLQSLQRGFRRRRDELTLAPDRRSQSRSSDLDGGIIAIHITRILYDL